MYWKNKKVLVTGGAGFIGSKVVSKLIDLGANVRVVDDLSKGEAFNLPKVIDKMEFIQGDLLNAKFAARCMEGIEICFHLAARIGGIGYFHKYPATSLRDNILINLNLWDAAKATKPKMVCLSSSMVFENTTIFPTPEWAISCSPPPLTGYGFSKLADEYIAKTYYEEFSVPYVIARPFNAYGPGENYGDYVGYAHVIPDLVNKINSGQYPLEILGKGDQIRCYTYVDDIANGIIFVAEYAENDDYNIGSNVETSVINLAKLLWKICGRKELVKFKTIFTLKYDVQRRVPSVAKVKHLGWEAKTPLEEGLRNTAEWLRNKNGCS